MLKLVHVLQLPLSIHSSPYKVAPLLMLGNPCRKSTGRKRPLWQPFVSSTVPPPIHILFEAGRDPVHIVLELDKSPAWAKFP